ncbi:cilia- and flagella-associated protein 58-like [Tribolium madens]|uniref:cilia- and flagella-associated protein 58-like n=1 Tax=Tribolium madens TaxID=41895 RepID=UPI001CF7378F|nr:cilia- and flagella-associated protein 58-like [Tribolium madens]
MEESDFSEGNDAGDDAQEEYLDPSNPEHAFAILERDFNKTVAEIEQHPEASHYAEDFHRLFEQFYTSYQKCKDLEEKGSLLTKELDEKTTIIETANKLADLDKGTITDLKTQIEHAWRLADAAHAREQAAQEAIDNLRKQIESLNAEIEFRNKMGEDTSEEMGQLSKHKEGLERENEKLLGEVSHLTQKLNNALEYQNELERKTSMGDMKISELAGQLEDQVNETEKFKRIRDKLESDITELNFRIEDRDTHVSNLNAVIASHLKSIGKLEEKIKEEKVAREKINKDYETVSTKYAKLQEDFNAKHHTLEQLQKSYNKKLTDIKTFEDDLAHLRADFAKVTKQKEIFEKRMYLLEGEKTEMVADRNQLRQRIAIFEKEIDDLKRQNENTKRVNENITREKDIISKSVARYEAVNKDQHKLIKIQEQGKKKLEAELDNFIIETNKQAKQIVTLERQKNSLAEEQLNLTKKIEDSMDEIKLKKAEIYDLKKNISEAENRLRMQQNLYDQVRSERNALEKSLQESNAESGELKKKLKITNHQIEQLKEDVTTKEQLLIKEENIMRKVQKEKENLKVELNQAFEQVKNLKESISEKDAEEKRLHKQIMDNEKLIREQAKDLEQLMNERDILGSQLVRRNDEIALLHEKILILQATLQRGESQYAQRLEDIRLLKIEIKRLRQEHSLLSKNIKNSIDLKQEVFHLERDLMKWRLKCRALEEELQNPMNIHRWRKLEGSDPELLDVLQKVQILQKRLIKQSSEAIERERQLKEAEKLYLSLKQVLAKQPGPGIREELTKTQKALKSRGDQLKCLVSELNMAELQAKEYKSDLQRVTEELNELKKKYIAEKKSQRLQKLAHESSREVNQNGAQVKYTGGGFRMSVQSISSFN